MYKIAILGLGYVGLPLAVALGKKYKLVGYDLNTKRITQLKSKIDYNSEFKKKDLLATNITYTSILSDLKECNIYIVTVPTPVNSRNKPDLRPIIKATRDISKYLKKNDIVVYESTVFPGVTEEICAPILEKNSKLKFNKDFFCGYSPERINPGDKIHKLENIVKVVSGSNRKSLNIIKKIYGSITGNKIYVAKNIKTAEAAKVIENTQRDINISLVNECAILFNKMNLNIHEVLETAGTKWNFLNFHPGLVGGHCIGVDPYYLTYKAEQIGIVPKVILAGRKVNNFMTKHVCNLLLKHLNKKNKKKRYKILIFGATFKENISDIRNSKILDVGYNLIKKGHKVDFIDYKVKKLSKFNLITKIKKNYYDGVIIAVAHKKYIKMKSKLVKTYTTRNSIILDITNRFEKSPDIIGL